MSSWTGTDSTTLHVMPASRTFFWRALISATGHTSPGLRSYNAATTSVTPA